MGQHHLYPRYRNTNGRYLLKIYLCSEFSSFGFRPRQVQSLRLLRSLLHLLLLRKPEIQDLRELSELGLVLGPVLHHQVLFRDLQGLTVRYRLEKLLSWHLSRKLRVRLPNLNL